MAMPMIMYEKPKKAGAPLKAKTSHTLNKVPFIVYNYDCKLKQDDDMGLSNIAATVCEILGVKPNEHWRSSIIEVRRIIERAAARSNLFDAFKTSSA